MISEITLKRDSYLEYSATINVYRYSVSTPVNQTRTTLRSVATVPARKISIVSPAEGSSASAVTIRKSSPSRLVRDIYTKNIKIEDVYCDVCDCYYSDHDIVSCVIKCK